MNEIDMLTNFSLTFSNRIGDLYEKLHKYSMKNKSLTAAYESKGGYDILISAKELIEKKIDEGEITQITKFDELVLKFCTNILKNRAKTPDKVFGDIQYLDFNENEYIQFEIAPILENQKKYPLKEDLGLDSILETVEKMYSNLYLGNVKKCQELAKYLKKIIDAQKDFDLKKFSEGILFLFRAEYFFNLGKLDISNKNIKLSIEILHAYRDKFGYQFLSKAYNFQAMILLNGGKAKEGFNIFNKNIIMLNGLEKHSDFGVEKLIKECDRFEYMFSFNTNKKSFNQLKYKVLETDDTHDKISNGYAKSYLFIDAGKSEEGLLELQRIKENISLEKSPLEITRHYVALSEAMLSNFENSDPKDLLRAYDYLLIAKNNNDIISNNFFSSMILILEGFIIGDKKTSLHGIEMLRKNQYIHYANWYERKIFSKKE